MYQEPKYSLSEEAYRALLRDQQITPEGTGTILRDIAAMLEAIGLEGVSTSSKQGNLLFMTRAFAKGWTRFEEFVHV